MNFIPDIETHILLSGIDELSEIAKKNDSNKFNKDSSFNITLLSGQKEAKLAEQLHWQKVSHMRATKKFEQFDPTSAIFNRHDGNTKAMAIFSRDARSCIESENPYLRIDEEDSRCSETEVRNHDPLDTKDKLVSSQIVT